MKRIMSKLLHGIADFLKRRCPGIYYSIFLYFYHSLNGFYRKCENTIIEKYVRSVHTEQEEKEFRKQCHKKLLIIEGKSKANEIKKLLKKVEINSEKNSRFFYSIDEYKTCYSKNRLIGNCTIDYEKIINHSISELYMLLDHNSEFVNENNIVINAIIEYLKRCIKYVKKSQLINKENIVNWLRNMLIGRAATVEEAFQRILFINMLMWQTGHRLVGLGRLDYILKDLYKSDLDNNLINENITVEIIEDFCKALHQKYWYKSDALMGDTGQIIILGGVQSDGTYFCNELTFAFIKAVKQLHISNPKLLLRMGKSMPMEVLKQSIDCIKTGIGSPILSNDNQVIPNLIEFGYAKEDAYNYVTSACWEPLVPANSHEQNNIGLINFLAPFQIISDREGYGKITSMDKLLKRYEARLKNHIRWVCYSLDQIQWEKDPFISAFTSSCRDEKLDISEGGGKYNNYGILSVAMSNAVNALINIKKYVFEEKLFTLQMLDLFRQNDFRGHEDIRELLKSESKFGTDEEEVIQLTNYILNIANKVLGSYKNKFGGKAKFGLSAPGYIEASKIFPASFDGRKNCEPFAVHISSDKNDSYTELMRFAAKLDYSDRKFNGNVVDFIVSPSFIENNFDKFVDFIFTSMKLGVYQMQLNVVDGKTLIAARKNPDKFPNLIVRVWGFSAYYIELPDEYKDYLIQRTLQSEKAS